MIYKIYANNNSFRLVEFSVGLNVILADKKIESSAKDTRNGVGKTTFLEVLHFCLGADSDKVKLPKNEIMDWVFTIELELCGERLVASRSIEKPSIIVISGALQELPIAPEFDEKEDLYFYKNDVWKLLLGKCLFQIIPQAKTAYSPSFRTLISYFIRRSTDAYNKPFEWFRTQPTWSSQVHNAYLLGLNWSHAAELEEIKDRSKAIKAIVAAQKTGLAPTQGELEADRVKLQTQTDAAKEALNSFNVHPQYEEIQNEVNSLTKKIHEATNYSLVLKRKLERYKEAAASEHGPANTDVEQLYAEAGLNFPDALKRTLNEVQKFHATIIENRKQFLTVEISEIADTLKQIKLDISRYSEERSSSMRVLQTHGALEEYTALHEKYSEQKNLLDAVKQRIVDLKEIKIRKQEIKSQQINLEAKITRDYEQASSARERAVSAYSENCSALYAEGGKLIINAGDKGYKFDVEIARSSSEGVSKMKIFCYDLMLVELWSAIGGIDFLVHDSTLYDGVDSRQVANALELAHKKAVKNNFQYICTFNSDSFPTEGFSEGFKIDDFVRLHLHDKDPQGSLLGFSYNL